MTQAERTALSDQRMFDTAIELINKHGTQGTTLKNIGELAGYSRGLANYRFGSKKNFMGELFSQFDHRWKEHLTTRVGDQSGLNAILAAARALREFLTLETNYMRAMYILWYESLGNDSDIRTKLAEHHDVYRADAQRWIEEGIAAGEIDESIDSKQFAVHFCAFIFGLVYQWLINSEALDLDTIFDEHEVYTIKLLRKGN
ncbi:MAG: TetR family transcriptional regulator [Gammaproteobacteria bacterium]|jgi:AcrR family transcriptional regulator|nr:TetR family transcriptional regulator [Gammaproteobacteria bacterium]